MNIRHLTVLSGVLLLLLSVPTLAAEVATYTAKGKATSHSKIDQAYNIGSISLGDKIIHNLQAALDPENLPDEFKTADIIPIKSATPFILEAQRNWELLSPAQKSQVSAYLYRPVLDSTYISPDGYFYIHYNISFPDSTPIEDLDESGVPDYVERVAVYADSAHRYYQGYQGYFPPPPDADGHYDIYLVTLGYAYGLTAYDMPGDSAWSDYTSYIKINCNMAYIVYENQDPEGDVIGALKVTSGHEFFHATQFAYDAYEELWWLECTATANESVLFGDVKDNYQYLPEFFNYPDSSLTSGPYYCYGVFVWPLYLINAYDSLIIRTIIEYTRFYDILASIDSALAPYDTDLTRAYPEFTLWNYFTGDRDDGNHYFYGADYPHMPWDQIVADYPFEEINPVTAPDGLGCNYLVSHPGTTEPDGILKLAFDGAEPTLWGFSYILFEGDEIIEVPACEIDMYGRTFAGVYDYARYDSMVFMPSVVSYYDEGHLYDFLTEILPLGDMNGNGEVNLSDILYLINFIYVDGPGPIGGDYTADVDCDGKGNLSDILYLINSVYNQGPKPCLYRPD